MPCPSVPGPFSVRVCPCRVPVCPSVQDPRLSVRPCRSFLYPSVRAALFSVHPCRAPVSPQPPVRTAQLPVRKSSCKANRAASCTYPGQRSSLFALPLFDRGELKTLPTPFNPYYLSNRTPREGLRALAHATESMVQPASSPRQIYTKTHNLNFLDVLLWQMAHR